MTETPEQDGQQPQADRPVAPDSDPAAEPSSAAAPPSATDAPATQADSELTGGEQAGEARAGEPSQPRAAEAHGSDQPEPATAGQADPSDAAENASASNGQGGSDASEPAGSTPRSASERWQARKAADAEKAGQADAQDGDQPTLSEADRQATQTAHAVAAVPGPKDPRQIDVDAELEQELNSAMEDPGIAGLVDREMKGPAKEEQKAEAASQAGQQQEAEGHEFEYKLVRARISAIRGDDVFVDVMGVDGKNQGIVPLTQFERAPRVGSIMDFVVQQVNEAEGLLVLSREGAVTQSTWASLQKNAVVEARVTGTNKGGLELEMVGGISAFMPASQVDIGHIEDLESLVGQKLKAMVQEIDRKSRKVVLSRRQYQEHEKKLQVRKLLDELEEGQVREGKVRSLVDYGAFIDLGGLDGLLHISDMSHARIKKPSEVLKEGDTVSVKVLGVEKDKKRVKLGLKQVEPDPWEGITERLSVGEPVSGRVVRTASFGAFIEIETGLEGLLPISEASWKRIGDVTDVLKEGDVVRVTVIALEPEKRRMTLSLKQAQGDPWEDAESKYARGNLVEGTVTKTTEFGAFVELEPGVEGMVHISELADRHVKNVTEVVKQGDTKEFRVLEVDPQNRKLKLSLKAVKAGLPEQQAEPAGKPSKKPAAKRRPPRQLKGGLE